MPEDKRIQLAIRFGYDGQRFFGLAIQPDRPTAAAALKTRILESGIYPKALNFAARTDRGVHALGNICTCWFAWDDPLNERRGRRPSVPTAAPQEADVQAKVAELASAITAERDDGLRDVRVTWVDRKVHARGSATAKHYRYVICDGLAGEIARPRDHPEFWPVVPRLDVEQMRLAATHLCGNLDFSSFRSPRCSAPVPVRQIDSVEVRRVVDSIENSAAGGLIKIDVRGTSFLRQMVRIVVGTLGLVGAGMLRPADVEQILLAKDRRRSGPVAPAGGLTLVRVVGNYQKK